MDATNPTDPALDLYARVEDLLGVQEAAPDLYAHYLLTLQSHPFDSLLDVGCGSGAFLRAMQGAFPHAQCHGIDLSAEMVHRARANGVEATVRDLCDVTERYDVITAVFDVLNYLPSDTLERFGRCVRERLNDDGLFLCDVTSFYGFETIASGAFQAEDDTRFVAIDAEFDSKRYTSDFVLFERDGRCWHRTEATIDQYYYETDALANKLGLTIISQDPVMLYGDDADKVFLVMGV